MNRVVCVLALVSTMASSVAPDRIVASTDLRMKLVGCHPNANETVMARLTDVANGHEVRAQAARLSFASGIAEYTIAAMPGHWLVDFSDGTCSSKDGLPILVATGLPRTIIMRSAGSIPAIVDSYRAVYGNLPAPSLTVTLFDITLHRSRPAALDGLSYYFDVLNDSQYVLAIGLTNSPEFLEIPIDLRASGGATVMRCTITLADLKRSRFDAQIRTARLTAESLMPSQVDKSLANRCHITKI